MAATTAPHARVSTTWTRAAIAFAALAPSAAALWYVYGAASPRAVQAAYFASKCLIFPFPLWWWCWAERRRRERAPGASRGRDLLGGAASGVLIAGLIGLCYALGLGELIDAEELRRRVRDFGAYDAFVPIALFLCVVNSGLEEYYWRWFVFGRLRGEVGLARALVLAGGAFAAHHFIVLHHHLQDPWLAAVFSAGVAAGGVIWSLHYHFTGRLAGIWLSHFLVDVAAMACAYDLLF